jgi:hypothetical protein
LQYDTRLQSKEKVCEGYIDVNDLLNISNQIETAFLFILTDGCIEVSNVYFFYVLF